MKLNYGDCFIEPEDQTREKIKRIYFVKDIDKETYTTICIHLDCKGQVTERTDYKNNIIRQMRKFYTPQKYFSFRKYINWVENIFGDIIPKTYVYEYCPFELSTIYNKIYIGMVDIPVPVLEPISGQIDLSKYFKEDKR